MEDIRDARSDEVEVPLSRGGVDDKWGVEEFNDVDGGVEGLGSAENKLKEYGVELKKKGVGTRKR